MMVNSIFRWIRKKVRGGVRRDYSPLTINRLDPESVKNFVLEWNTKFPIDRWWREKHAVAFNSAQHREVSIIDMRVEWEEDILYNKIRNEVSYEMNKGEFLKEKIAVTEQESLKQFIEEEKDFDYSQYDDNK